jgi:hypothetical protein
VTVGAWFALCVALSAAPKEDGLSALAAQVVAKVEATRPATPLALAISAPSAPLRDAFATLLAAKLGNQKLAPSVLATTGFAAEAEARSVGASTLVRLSLSVEESELFARGDVISTWVNFWSGRTPTRSPTVAAGVVAHVALDATVKSWLPDAKDSGGPLLFLPREPWLKLDGPITALAAGDVDGDGRPEVLVLSNEELTLFSRSGQRLAQWQLSGLPLANEPSRAPTGFLVVTKDLRVGLLSSAHEPSLWLTYEPVQGAFVPSGETKTLPACGGQLQREPAKNTFSVSGPLPGSGIWACAEREGQGKQELRVYADGTAKWNGAPLGKLGAGSTLAMLEPGKVVLVSSLFAYQPEQDVLRVGPPEHPSQTLELPGRILQVVAADLSGRGLDDLLVGVALEGGTSAIYWAQRAGP